MLEAAISYASRNLCVFPCEKKIPLTGTGGFKNATCDLKLLLEWWTKNPQAQIGVPTGSINRLLVLDVDGPEGEAALQKLNLPETFTVETRPGRKQFWFAQPEGVTTRNSAGLLAPQIDTRGDGGYVIAPPSIHHQTGKPYRVVKNLPWATAPAALIEPRSVLPAKPTSGDLIVQGKRHQTLLSIAGALRARGLSQPLILHQLEIVNQRQCDPPLDGADLERIAAFVGSKPPGFSGSRATETSSEVKLQYYSAVQRERIKWLWPGRIPTGKLTLFVGDPGTGKSLVTVDLAARVSTGRAFPDGCSCEVGGVLILTAEDDAKDTVGPRLDAAGADTSRIARISAVKVTLSDGAPAESTFSLERDLLKLEEALTKDAKFKLIIVDPLTAYLGTKINSWRDTDVRGLLTPLTEFATRTGIAVGGIMHLRKSETDAMLRVSGSVAFVAAARTVWGFGIDPADKTQRAMVAVKNNLASLANALVYKIAVNDEGVPFISWQKEPRTLDAEDVLGGNKKEKRAIADAAEWLRQQLAGGPQPQQRLQADAKRERISFGTLRRAKDHLGIRSHKAGLAGFWYWELPEHAHKEVQHAQVQN
jgi:hypothetical protein